jgi:hypothetical protein
MARLQSLAMSSPSPAACVWVVDSSSTRMVTLIQDTAWILSHYRPDPELVDVTRAAVTLSAAYTFLTQGPHTLRPLVTLRRLPPGPPTR